MFLAIFVIYVFVNAQKVVHPRGVNHVSFVISAVTTTQYSMKKLEKLSWQKNHANHNFVIYVFVNAQKVVHPRGLNHMSFVISAVTTTQCSMRKLEKLELTKSHRPNWYISLGKKKILFLLTLQKNNEMNPRNSSLIQSLFHGLTFFMLIPNVFS